MSLINAVLKCQIYEWTLVYSYHHLANVTFMFPTSQFSSWYARIALVEVSGIKRNWYRYVVNERLRDKRVARLSLTAVFVVVAVLKGVLELSSF